eukprot:CAMPEP_0198155406 /NCGR_PEP_ID=MMETSP1443-20131203/69104_1 /TAXON_ID=186043 /ORGANISM="Entomoneis sp., Strain CCMP2396" /LENGTH=153 /DNA_ID=CAMNT_0043822155 /DNA_START=1010 /DNA_END=1473 /DNA_ORIENTATION=-
MKAGVVGGVAVIPMRRTWHLGFARLKGMVRVDSIFHSQHYDHNLDGMVFDYANGFDLYRQAVDLDLDGMVFDYANGFDLYRQAAADSDADTQAASATSMKTSLNTTQTICELLPEEDAMARHMTNDSPSDDERKYDDDGGNNAEQPKTHTAID